MGRWSSTASQQVKCAALLSPSPLQHTDQFYAAVVIINKLLWNQLMLHVDVLRRAWLQGVSGMAKHVLQNFYQLWCITLCLLSGQFTSIGIVLFFLSCWHLFCFCFFSCKTKDRCGQNVNMSSIFAPVWICFLSHNDAASVRFRSFCCLHNFCCQ